MFSLIDHLPVELVGTNVLGYLSLKDIVLLERACSSNISHQLFMSVTLYCPPVLLPFYKHAYISVLGWFLKRMCTISFLSLRIPGDNPIGHWCFNVLDENLALKVEYLDLRMACNVSIKSFKYLQGSPIRYRVRNVDIYGDQNREVMEQLSACTRNIKQLTIRFSNCMDWITADILARWKLTEISLTGLEITTPLLTLIVQTCTELTSIKLNSRDDAAIMAIAHTVLS